MTFFKQDIARRGLWIFAISVVIILPHIKSQDTVSYHMSPQNTTKTLISLN